MDLFTVMGLNSDLYLDTLGNSYYFRRKEVLGKLESMWESDPIITAMLALGITRGSYFEIGCANGWRMDVLNREFNMSVSGIEPSIAAKGNREYIITGTADKIPLYSTEVDVVAFAYVLYTVDRSDLFKIASEADRILRDSGHMIVYDFYSEIPAVRQNPDCKDILTCKTDYGGMFRWHPCYREVYSKVQREPDNPNSHPVVVNVFQKQLF